MKYLLIILIVILSGCSTVKYKSYENGQLKEDYYKYGANPWSPGKQFSFEVHGV